MSKLRDSVAKLNLIMTVRPFDKPLFHRQGKAVLKLLAEHLKLPAYEVRSNPAGPAMNGEIVLHSPAFYIMICGDVLGRSDKPIMYRKCSGMRDFTGGQNCWTGTLSLGNDDFHTVLRGFIGTGKVAA